MKTKLLIVLFFGILSVEAQTTHNLDWHINFLSPATDLTVEIGDTVIWTWTDIFPHTVQNAVGNSVETFNSGTLTGNGSTFSYTFTVVGVNDYFCGIHGALSMSGTITVQNTLGIDDNILKKFSILTNPVNQELNINVSPSILQGDEEIIIYDLLGKKNITKKIGNKQNVIIDVSDLSSGLYMITIASKNIKISKRFIKK
jgi:plastocyanin